MTGFQSVVNTQPAPAQAGDFASANPRATALAGPGAYIAGASGLTIGRFCWDDESVPGTVNNFGNGPVSGFVHREMQGLITIYLTEAGYTIPAGFTVGFIFIAGDFWVKNDGATQAVPGQKAYANYSNGAATFAATASPTQAASVTGAVTAGTASVTGSIADNILTVTAVGSGSLVVGGTLSGTNVSTGTMIKSQISGTAGGIGTYYVSIGEQTAASTTISETYGILTVTAVGSGALGVGDVIAGTSVVAGTYISALGTGTGGTGTYILTNNTAISSETITANANVETKWVAANFALPGELVKMTSWPAG